MVSMSPNCEVTVVPTGVDVEQFRRPASAAAPLPIVMFLGSMDWPANIDGVEFFCQQIWPRILGTVPAAKFRVVGRTPPPRVRRLESASVEIVGGVESVVPHLHAAAVFVVPLRIGGGTRLKIYEAMAAALPVVSTRVGAEGLEVTPGDDIILADDPAEFARSVVELLTDERRRDEIARAAARTAARFDWEEISKEFESVLGRTVASERSGEH